MIYIVNNSTCTLTKTVMHFDFSLSTSWTRLIFLHLHRGQDWFPLTRMIYIVDNATWTRTQTVLHSDFPLCTWMTRPISLIYIVDKAEFHLLREWAGQAAHKRKTCVLNFLYLCGLESASLPFTSFQINITLYFASASIVEQYTHQ